MEPVIPVRSASNHTLAETLCRAPIAADRSGHRALCITLLLLACASCSDDPRRNTLRDDTGDAQRVALRAEIRTLVRKIDLNPCRGKGQYTPAVLRLIEIGRPAIPEILPLMMDDNEDVRLYAQTALADILSAEYGFGPGWPNQQSRDAYRMQWARLGSLDWRSPPEARRQAVIKWQQWIASDPPTSPPAQR